MIFNPHAVDISVNPPDNVEFFRLTYLKDGENVAEIVQPANYNTNADFTQDLHPLNALVPEQAQGSDLSLAVRAGNSGGESEQASSPEAIQVENPPSTPSNIIVS